MMISLGCFLHFLDVFIFWAKNGKKWQKMAKGQKMAQDDKKYISVAVDISGTIRHMVVIYGTLV